MSKRRAIVVGAGISGVMAARGLVEHGWDVVVLEKSRGFGGRMATRRWDESAFDHGAQYFRITNTVAQSILQPLINCRVIVPWMKDDHPDSQARWVGREGMSSVVKGLADGLDVRKLSKVERIEACGYEWRLVCENGSRLAAEALVMSAPVPQSLHMLEPEISELDPRVLQQLERIRYAPGFALLAKVSKICERLPSGGIRLQHNRVAWIADNRSKWRDPSVPGADLTIQSSSAFAESFFESDREHVAAMLAEAAEPLIGQSIKDWQLHRWKYGHVESRCSEPCLYSCIPSPISFCGDAFGPGNVEGALLSGMAAAKRIQNEIGE